MNMIEKLSEVSQLLLDLHKELLEYEKLQYEGLYGRIAGANDYFSIVTKHPAFQWLRTLSELIVVFDEFAQDESVTDEKIKELLQYTKKLLTPLENGDQFSAKYFVAIQNQPAIAVAHGKVMQGLKD